ncbi:Anti-repressor SinI [Alteribacillus persepolensis]|uniref:Anti-repressor SinI n=1 Tax=Alteribacillus persepolensis TaxID=568899 RepID=A0A1G7Z6Z1_9BACI|nr:anti-repressor SinI family protein [Alteribacillus persepolensis]SDH04266.1 Anti-repressor SinI [Alteribacillus persepolensis]
MQDGVKDLDREWVELIKQAKAAGLKKEDIQLFLKTCKETEHCGM